MSKISLAPDASGTGIFTIASPNSNTNRTLTLPDDTGTIVTNSGNQAGSFTTLNTSGQVVFNDAGADVDFRVEGDTDANLLFVDASTDRVAVGSSSPQHKFQVTPAANTTGIFLQQASVSAANDYSEIGFGSVGGGSTVSSAIRSLFTNPASDSSTALTFSTTNVSTFGERARITSGGYFKASDNGTYDQPTGTFHEIRQTADNVGVYTSATNGSYSNPVFYPVVTRSANSAYSFLTAISGGSDTEFKLRGDGNAYADGTFNNNGADYAEYFESANGQALTLGATVVLDGNKVREATDQDPASSVIGVVRPKEPSKASMVIGNTAWNKWANKYLTDDFDRYIMEDHDVVEWEETITDEEGNTSTKQHSYESHAIPEGVTVPADATRKTHDEKGNKFQHYKLNPAWNPDSEYVNRENRPEWNIIGLLGQVKILKGQPVGDRWIKMRDVSEAVEEWMIR